MKSEVRENIEKMHAPAPQVAFPYVSILRYFLLIFMGFWSHFPFEAPLRTDIAFSIEFGSIWGSFWVPWGRLWRSLGGLGGSLGREGGAKEGPERVPNEGLAPRSLQDASGTSFGDDFGASGSSLRRDLLGFSWFFGSFLDV